MKLRLLFEADTIEDHNKHIFIHRVTQSAMYKHLGMARFGGFISMAANEKKHQAMEPVWQFLWDNANKDELDEFMATLKETPMDGYITHVYSDKAGGSTKLGAF